MTKPRGRGGRERIVAAAAALFEAQGITATTMEQIAAKAPVSKRTLYAHFPTKDDLVVEFLQYVYRSGLTVESALYDADVPARERILAMFTVPTRGDGPVRGCPFVAAATEFPDPDSPAHAYTRERKQAFTLRIAELLTELGADDPHGLAEQLAILTDGVASRSMVFNDARRGDVGRAAAEALLTAAGL
ncbi:TetR family transcriptional regulator [Mycolicibacterium smegmatis]|uniref:Transcriptional regulator, TetR family n=4 Tax=Mycolicibacterium smegmatis TaxID=1772 RepID=I7FV10_MYCS2|nr:TetR family transcriptional regulator [Mycolicibacterium smegmatis]ABK73461.1 transcriptional regulator, TetR family protein [Mycolicibacterium smegmatis MC2 155]AFP42758.1 Transcriptional regulator, TetR family [Mycolicibacterium smegmatis MC2 155]AIU11479.1 TetR family transcriptional regulator [Mycolicibacterium smegmatis MC2 155]AIU18105.1 TetR family transcriptional regulator [Mycolicibacterium smegmatis]AIU24727.1 TetR family transcriptional regulator [Mycolicibacterium smegmatis]